MTATVVVIVVIIVGIAVAICSTAIGKEVEVKEIACSWRGAGCAVLKIRELH